jgi:hypothetical protein
VVAYAGLEALDDGRHVGSPGKAPLLLREPETRRPLSPLVGTTRVALLDADLPVCVVSCRVS